MMPQRGGVVNFFSFGAGEYPAVNRRSPRPLQSSGKFADCCTAGNNIVD